MTLSSRMILACWCVGMLTAAGAQDRSAEVDALFSRWNSNATPGMNIAVFSDGTPLFSRSFGMASIELAQPNQPGTVFPIGSISKQFTAYAIQLLAHDGKVALTDDVRKFIPQLHDYGAPITLDMLLTHTSGLRDNVTLLTLQGHRIDDVVSYEDSFDAVIRQRGLNFRPGARYHYSNANYVLLAKVIERVSGMSFADFISRRVLQPLAMGSTSIVTNPIRVTPHRASGYSRSSDSVYSPQPTVDSTYGSNGMLSTIADLAIWSANFYGDAKVTPEVFSAMTRTGVLTDGIPITYASGLHVEKFRGLPYVEHTGAVAGFHSNLLVFPEQRLSIIVLANNDECDATALAFAVAGIYLKNDFRQAAPRPKPVLIAGSTLDKYVGTYEILTGTSLKAPGRRITFTRDGNALRFADEDAPLLAASRTQFFSPTSDFRVSFEPMRDEKSSWLAVVQDPAGTDLVGRRLAEPAAASTPSASPSGYPGLYYSTELETAFVIVRRGDALSVRTARGEVPLKQQAPAAYAAEGDRGRGQFRGTITFMQKGEEVDGLLVSSSNRRASNIRFVKASGGRDWIH